MRTIRGAKVFVRSRKSVFSFCILPFYFILQAERLPYNIRVYSCYSRLVWFGLVQSAADKR
jgi:hypothetical protein